jgi:hypothetical protein
LKNLKEKQETDAANKEKVKAKLPVKLYGFIDAQFIWGDSTVTTLGRQQTHIRRSPTQLTTSSSRRTTPSSGQHLKHENRPRLAPDKLGKRSPSGESSKWIFINPGGGNSPRPRIRLAYGYLEGTHWQLLGGQDWDVFSPLNTATQQIGSNLWFGGNLGFRRPQLKFTYSIPCCNDAAVKLIASINNPGNVDTVMNNTNTSGWPYGEASVLFTKADE